MIKGRFTIFSLVLIGVSSAAQAETNRELYSQTKSTLEQWVETENLVSKERNRWREEKILLTDTLNMLEEEKAALQAKLEEQASDTTIADEKRVALLEESDILEKSRLEIEIALAGLEEGVRRLLPRLPENFSDSVQALIRRIPQDSSDTTQSISQRLRNIVALLSQASKFDNTISLEREVREMPDGSSKEVSALYFGFAIAYYADPSGQYAGYGYPDGSGWSWVDASDYGVSILKAIAMYEKTEQAAFVSLPVTIN